MIQGEREIVALDHSEFVLLGRSAMESSGDCQRVSVVVGEGVLSVVGVSGLRGISDDRISDLSPPLPHTPSLRPLTSTQISPFAVNTPLLLPGNMSSLGAYLLSSPLTSFAANIFLKLFRSKQHS